MRSAILIACPFAPGDVPIITTGAALSSEAVSINFSWFEFVDSLFDLAIGADFGSHDAAFSMVKSLGGLGVVSC